MNYLLKTIFLICCFIPGYSQDFNYVQYGTKEGLAGSTVYDLCQDQNGFIWFATDYGLSRFDGTSFKNFTVKDGLPDNEVIRLFPDSKGRVWIASLNNEICYYQNNKINTIHNDTVLSKIILKSNVYAISEDLTGNILLCDLHSLVMVTSDNKVIYINELPGMKNLKGPTFGGYANYFDGGFIIHDQDSAFKLIDGKLKFFHTIAKTQTFTTTISRVFPDGKLLFVNTPSNRTSVGTIGYSNSAFIVNTLDGSWTIDTITNKLSDHFLPGKTVSQTIIDMEKNMWFATLGHGVFKLISKNIKTIKSGVQDQRENEVYSLSESGGRIYAGKAGSKALIIENGKYREINYSKYLASSSHPSNYNRLYSSKTLPSGELILGFDNFLIKNKNEVNTFLNLLAVKSIETVDSNHILVGTSKFAYKLSVKDFKIVDTIWKGRCTKVYYHNDKFYIGSLDGLLEIDQNKSVKQLGKIQISLSRRINDITLSSDGILWIATNDKGILGLKDNRIIYSINDSNGLTSNICKSLFINKQTLYVGTNKGLNIISFQGKDYSVMKFVASDGLPDNNINAILVADSLIWLGTPSGLTYFKEDEIKRTSICKLILEEVRINGSIQKPANEFQLKYNANNISFDYTGISFKSGGELLYKYRLLGLDSAWKETSSRTLDYPSIPPGHYEFQVFAINKFGINSNVITKLITVTSPFWKNWWFYTLAGIFLVSITGLITKRIYALRIRKQQERNTFEKQVSEMEQQALQAQMNPHFIFNCLNSIQQYILTRDVFKANKYLTEFASLIRLTLYNSGKKTISIKEEVEYLTRYLNMEKMRFGENFTYNIEIADDVDTSEWELPAMLLQPYVENCFRHGIRYNMADPGKIDIKFFMCEESLCCIISDNGIGRAKAAELKSAQHLEYQSKGMELTAKRIQLLNKITSKYITVEVSDVLKNNGDVGGTMVTLKLAVV